ncbi:SDR family oxidoreductase [Brevibacterium sp. 91QC2O2]|uniref:SDR family oxidoreductase n=1 Tax=Brevibacterium sp. 91QC2O2 TaxID=2968458 RepID=UPI00211B833B|nr:SDR family oxidoreductase [Brevibacterium sp. 91QC2O2]MCQ9368720.1 SDR family oxidoreductase [Brevibacterium sp. 91QC2O2]
MKSTKTALVTGASRGIGRAVVEDLVRDHTVFGGASRPVEEADRIAGVDYFASDLAAPAVDFSTFPDLADMPDGLDVLVQSAGIAIQDRLEDLDRAAWEKSFAVNVFAVAEITQRYLPALRKARGTIVFINSGSGLMSYARGLPYTATKFALHTLADCVREELRDDGVRVVSVHPGFVDTDMGKAVRGSGGRDYDPDYFVKAVTVAEAVRVAVDADRSAQFETITVRPAKK